MVQVNLNWIAKREIFVFGKCCIEEPCAGNPHAGFRGGRAVAILLFYPIKQDQRAKARFWDEWFAFWNFQSEWGIFPYWSMCV